MEQNQLPSFMTAGHVAQFFGIGLRTAYEMIHGPLAACVVRVGAQGKGYRVVRDKLLAWVEAEASKPVDAPIPGRDNLSDIRRSAGRRGA